MSLTKPPVGTKVRFIAIKGLSDRHPVNLENRGKIGVVVDPPRRFSGRCASHFLDVRFEDWEENSGPGPETFLFCHDEEFEVVE